MTRDMKVGVLKRIIIGIFSMTLLMYLLLVMLLLFPRIVICILAVLTVPILFRYLPKYRETSQNES